MKLPCTSTDDGVTWSEIAGSTSSADTITKALDIPQLGISEGLSFPADGGDITDPSTWEWSYWSHRSSELPYVWTI